MNRGAQSGNHNGWSLDIASPKRDVIFCATNSSSTQADGMLAGTEPLCPIL
jgi:hypothetical protein